MNDLLQEWLHHSSIRKREEIFSESIKKLQRKERNKISNLKCWKSKNISSSKQISEEIQWQTEIFRNKAEEKTDETDENYIILMKVKNHLWFRISSTTTCIDERFRKASWIRKVKKKTSSRTVIECIRNINKSISTNWVKFREQQLRRSVYWNKWRLIWDSLTENKKTQH